MDLYRTSVALNNLAITMMSLARSTNHDQQQQDGVRNNDTTTTTTSSCPNDGDCCAIVAAQTFKQSIAFMNAASAVHCQMKHRLPTSCCPKRTLKKAQRFVSQQQQRQQQQDHQHVTASDTNRAMSFTTAQTPLAIDDTDLESLYSLVLITTATTTNSCCNHNELPQQLIPIRISSFCNDTYYPINQATTNRATSCNLSTMVLQQHVTLLYNNAVSNLQLATTTSLHAAQTSFNMALDMLDDLLEEQEEEMNDDDEEMDNDTRFILTMMATLCCVGLMQCRHKNTINDHKNNNQNQEQNRLSYWMKQVDELYLAVPRNSTSISSSAVMVVDTCRETNNKHSSESSNTTQSYPTVPLPSAAAA